jgi:hypothetical protein
VNHCFLINCNCIPSPQSKSIFFSKTSQMVFWLKNHFFLFFNPLLYFQAKKQDCLRLLRLIGAFWKCSYFFTKGIHQWLIRRSQGEALFGSHCSRKYYLIAQCTGTLSFSDFIQFFVASLSTHLLECIKVLWHQSSLSKGTTC